MSSEVKNEGLGVVAYAYPDQLRGLFKTCGSATCAVWNKPAGPRVALCRHSEALAGYAVRDARIAELEEEVKTSAECLDMANELYETYKTKNGQLLAELATIKAQGVTDFVFSGELPNATFVEVEDGNGNSINVGEWLKRDDGYSVLRLYAAPVAKQVVLPDRVVWIDAHHIVPGTGPALIGGMCLVSPEQLSGTQVPLTLCRLNAADHAEGGI